MGATLYSMTTDRYAVVIVDKRDGTATTLARYQGDAGADSAAHVANMVNDHGNFVAVVVDY